MARKGIIGLISALIIIIGGGTYLIVAPEELADTYICPSNGNVGVFPGGISSSGLTAYITNNNSTGSKRCSVPWEKCSSYAEKNNFTCLDTIPVMPCSSVMTLEEWTLNIKLNESGWTGYEFIKGGDYLIVLTNTTKCLELQ